MIYAIERDTGHGWIRLYNGNDHDMQATIGEAEVVSRAEAADCGKARVLAVDEHGTTQFVVIEFLAGHLPLDIVFDGRGGWQCIPRVDNHSEDLQRIASQISDAVIALQQTVETAMRSYAQVQVSATPWVSGMGALATGPQASTDATQSTNTRAPRNINLRRDTTEEDPSHGASSETLEAPQDNGLQENLLPLWTLLNNITQTYGDNVELPADCRVRLETILHGSDIAATSMLHDDLQCLLSSTHASARLTALHAAHHAVGTAVLNSSGYADWSAAGPTPSTELSEDIRPLLVSLWSLLNSIMNACGAPVELTTDYRTRLESIINAGGLVAIPMLQDNLHRILVSAVASVRWDALQAAHRSVGAVVLNGGGYADWLAANNLPEEPYVPF